MTNEGLIYMISGLGADKRAFQFLTLDFEARLVHIEWLQPKKKESLPDYCGRLIGHYTIKDPEAIIGLSFGGIIAQEIAKQVKTKKILLISSVRTKYDLPRRYRMAGKLSLSRLVPKSKLGQSNYFIEKGFGVKTTEERELLRQILNETNPDFAYWAINAISKWQNTARNKLALRIHGTHDKIIPLKNAVDFKIAKAGHFMIVQNAPEISEILNAEISQLV